VLILCVDLLSFLCPLGLLLHAAGGAQGKHLRPQTVRFVEAGVDFVLACGRYCFMQQEEHTANIHGLIRCAEGSIVLAQNSNTLQDMHACMPYDASCRKLCSHPTYNAVSLHPLAHHARNFFDPLLQERLTMHVTFLIPSCRKGSPCT
jgi:hypothetical protein